MKIKTIFILIVVFVNICFANDNVSLPSQKITFIELGSAKCPPCRMMQPIMANIEKKYGGQIKIVFYDIWTKEHEKYARIYRINAIPSQIFLDENGNEIHRHTGFYPEKEIDLFLSSKGIKPLK